jgi:hypothetical protein
VSVSARPHGRVSSPAKSRRVFPDGLTVLNATGQWQDEDHGRLVREPSKLVVIITADDTPAHDKIAASIAAYKQRL